MRLFLDDREVTLSELKQTLDNLDYGSPDGGTYEVISLVDIIDDEDIYLQTEKYSIYG